MFKLIAKKKKGRSYKGSQLLALQEAVGNIGLKSLQLVLCLMDGGCELNYPGSSPVGLSLKVLHFANEAFQVTGL